MVPCRPGALCHGAVLLAGGWLAGGLLGEWCPAGQGPFATALSYWQVGGWVSGWLGGLNALYCTVMGCTALYCVILFVCSVLYCTVKCCTALHCAVSHCLCAAQHGRTSTVCHE